jgi:hypothetical protein
MAVQLNYDFNATALGSLGLAPQMSNMGMLELHLSRIGIPEGKAALMIGLSDFKLPETRKVSPETINYLFGSVNYPGKVGKAGDLSCTFNDYINGRQRRVLHKWFDLVFDERTGLGAPVSDLKADGVAILFDRNGMPRMKYEMHGLWPTQDPSFPNVDYKSGSLVTIDMSFSVDWFEEKFSDIVEVVTIGTPAFQGETSQI